MYTKSRAISYKTIQKNTKLSDFPDVKDLVVENAVKNVPDSLKENNSATNSQLTFYF